MSITDHPGFLASVAASSMTSTQAIGFIEAVAALEGSFAGCARSETAGDPVPSSAPPDQAQNPIASDRLEAVQYASFGFRKMPPWPSGNSSFDPSHMTSGEIMHVSENGVQP